VYRQKVLESYGYKFLRINRFNLGEKPDCHPRRPAPTTGRRRCGSQPCARCDPQGHQKAPRRRDRECPKCKELRNAEEFKDVSLPSGVGRFCDLAKA